MALNAAALYGRDVRCIRDADALWSSCEGLDVVQQDAYHRLTTDDIPGDGGQDSPLMIVGWGFDVRNLLGRDPAKLPVMQAVLAEVLQRDPRIQRATVELASGSTNGLADVQMRVSCETAAGPFEFVTTVQRLTAALLEGQGQP